MFHYLAHMIGDFKGFIKEIIKISSDSESIILFIECNFYIKEEWNQLIQTYTHLIKRHFQKSKKGC